MDALDQAHADYYARNPNGNHDKASPETLRMFQELTDEHIKPLEVRMGEVEKELDKKISFEQFVWVFGVLASVVAGMFYLVWNTLQDVQKNTTSTKETVSFIEGTLQNAQITK